MPDEETEIIGRDDPEGVNAVKPVAPEGQEFYLPPGATEPQLRPATAAAAKSAGGLKGKLPDDFPGYGALEEAGLTTYAKVRKSLNSLEDLDGIGPATAEKIREAMNESSEADEEAE